MHLILRRHLGVTADPLHHGGEVVVEGLPGDVGQPGRRPGIADQFRRDDRVGPVDRATTADCRARRYGEHPVSRVEEAAPQEELLVSGEFDVVEVGLVVVTAQLHDDHLLAGLGELACDEPASAAGSDHHDVGLVGLAFRWCDRLQGLGGLRRRLQGAGVLHSRPERVSARGVGQPVGEHDRQLPECGNRAVALR